MQQETVSQSRNADAIGAAAAIDTASSNAIPLVITDASAPSTAATAATGQAPNSTADTAVAGAAARTTYGVTGAGQKIGIISDSYNSNGGAAADQAAGYVPNVTVLGDQSGTDEGRAIAELVHETAPGAQIAFDTVGTSLNSFASAVTALQNAGCTVIVDDVSFAGEPFFQPGDVLENAIESFVAAGGDYFTSAGNNGGTYYQATFNGISTILPGMTTQVTAENFGGGNTLESFTHLNTGTLAIDLQWETPFRTAGSGGPNGQGAQDSLALYLYNSSNQLVASSTGNAIGGDPIQYIGIGSLAAGSYKIAVVLNGGSAPNIFRYQFVDNFYDDSMSDPNANVGGGNVYGHAVLADVNTVGAVSVYATPSQGKTPTAETYSSTGPGELLMDANGNVLSSPVYTGKVDYTAPDGSSTSVSGFSSFYGTSASAPVAAGTAALILQAQPSSTPAQVSADLAMSADPMGGASNVGAGLIQAPAAVAIADGAAGKGLVVDVSEDAYLGDAQFTVSVDGVQEGGIFTAKSSHAAGQTEAFTVATTLSSGTHKVALAFTNDAYGGSASQDRNLYVDGATYNGATIAGAAQALPGPSTDAFSVTVGAAVTSPAPTVPASSGLVVTVAEDAYLGDAQFTVSIDGKQVGGVNTATASYAAGQSQSFTVASTLSNGSHTVGISFINDAYGGSTSTDRNLYVTGASYNGTALPGVAAALFTNSTDSFVVTSGTALTSTAVIAISEDAYLGDAQFTVAVDGKQYGGTYTATASHSAGQSQSITVSGIPESFSAHDIAVTFLNDAYAGTPSTDRNLYVNAITLDNQAVPNASASLFSAGTQHFAALAPTTYTG